MLASRTIWVTGGEKYQQEFQIAQRINAGPGEEDLVKPRAGGWLKTRSRYNCIMEPGTARWHC